jgi:hypothetical protein
MAVVENSGARRREDRFMCRHTSFVSGHVPAPAHPACSRWGD